MSEQTPDLTGAPGAAEAGYVGITFGSVDEVDSDDLYEALLNPHDASGAGRGGAAGGPGMMMPPMMMGGMGGMGAAGAGAGGAGMAGAAGVAAAGGLASAAARGPMTGAGGGGLGAMPEAPGMMAADAGEIGGGPDLGGLGGGVGPIGGGDGPSLGSGGGLGGGPSHLGKGDDLGGHEPVSHSAETITSHASVWEQVAQAWPVVQAELDKLLGGEKGDAFGLVHEAEHGFNIARGWLAERAREATDESTAMTDALVEARKSWSEAEESATEHARKLNHEELS